MGPKSRGFRFLLREHPSPGASMRIGTRFPVTTLLCRSGLKKTRNWLAVKGGIVWRFRRRQLIDPKAALVRMGSRENRHSRYRPTFTVDLSRDPHGPVPCVPEITGCFLRATLFVSQIAPSASCVPGRSVTMPSGKHLSTSCVSSAGVPSASGTKGREALAAARGGRLESSAMKRCPALEWLPPGMGPNIGARRNDQ